MGRRQEVPAPVVAVVAPPVVAVVAQPDAAVVALPNAAVVVPPASGEAMSTSPRRTLRIHRQNIKLGQQVRVALRLDTRANREEVFSAV